MLCTVPPWIVHSPVMAPYLLKGSLEQAGIATQVFDMNRLLYSSLPTNMQLLWNAGAYEYWLESSVFQRLYAEYPQALHSLARTLAESGARVLGFTVNVVNITFLAGFLRYLREQGCTTPIVLGGPGIEICEQEELRKRYPLVASNISNDPQFQVADGAELLYDLVDVLVHGEGELAVVHVVEQLLAGKSEPFPGVVFTKSPAKTYLPSKPIEDLNAIAYPRYDDFADIGTPNMLITVLGSRGCIRKCTFCKEVALWPGFRFRSAANIFDEIRYHHQTYGATHFDFTDLLLNGHPKILEQLCDLVIASGLSLHFSGNMIIHPNFTAQLAQKLGQAGFRHITFGLESGSDAVLAEMQKHFTRKEAIRVLRLCKEYGLMPAINVIVGYPTETEDDFAQSLSLLDEIHECVNAINVLGTCLIFRQTPLSRRTEYNVVHVDYSPKAHAAVYWESSQAGDYANRLKRMGQFVEKCRTYGLPFPALVASQWGDLRLLEGFVDSEHRDREIHQQALESLWKDRSITTCEIPADPLMLSALYFVIYGIPFERELSFVWLLTHFRPEYTALYCCLCESRLCSLLLLRNQPIHFVLYASRHIGSPFIPVLFALERCDCFELRSVAAKALAEQDIRFCDQLRENIFTDNADAAFPELWKMYLRKEKQRYAAWQRGDILAFNDIGNAFPYLPQQLRPQPRRNPEKDNVLDDIHCIRLCSQGGDFEREFVGRHLHMCGNNALLERLNLSPERQA